MHRLTWLVLLGALATRAANAAESVVYFGADAGVTDGAAASKMTMVHHGGAGQAISVESLQLFSAERSGVPELVGATIPSGARASAEASAPELSFAVSFPVDVQVPSPGRYQLTLTLLPGKAWEDGQVQIVAVGRRVSGTGPAEFRREIEGWFLTFP